MDEEVILAVHLFPQLTRLWCWAASGQMIMDYHGAPHSQCSQANDYLLLSNCCTATPTDGAGGCIRGGWPQFDKYGFAFSRTARAGTGGVPLSWNELKREIDNDRPIAFSWHFGFGGHMMVAVGYRVVGGDRFVVVNDPWPPNVGERRSIPYDTYVQGEEHGSEHWFDFYGIEMTAAPGGNDGIGLPPAALNDARRAAEAFAATALTLAGVESPGGAASIYLGPELPVYTVDVQRLLQDAPGNAEENRLLSGGPNTVLFPIMTRGEFLAATASQNNGQKWSATTANASWLRIVNEMRSRHAAITGKSEASYLLLQARDLGLAFLATSDTPRHLMSVLDDPSLALQAGVVMDEAAVVEAFKLAAQSHNGRPG